MDFTPLNDKELKELNLYPEGRYRFRVLRTDQKISKAGNEYFNLKMVIEVNKRELPLFDMLFFEGKMLFKTKHFCETTGMPDKYNTGKLMPYECDGKEGYLDLVHRVNNQTGELQNSVKDYVAENVVGDSKENDFVDDDIPSFT